MYSNTMTWWCFKTEISFVHSHMLTLKPCWCCWHVASCFSGWFAGGWERLWGLQAHGNRDRCGVQHRRIVQSHTGNASWVQLKFACCLLIRVLLKLRRQSNIPLVFHQLKLSYGPFWTIYSVKKWDNKNVNLWTLVNLILWWIIHVIFCIDL